MRVTMLGSGTSHGIPVPSCHCPVCMSTDPHDKRYRSSVLLEKDGKTIVIDTGPEFRLQAIRADICHIDAVLYTHSHADHFNGIDDLRVYSAQKPLDVYSDESVMRDIEERFPYVLAGEERIGLPHLCAHCLPPLEETVIAGFPVTAVPVFHGKKTIYAYRIGSFAYMTDCSGVPESSIPALTDPQVLVIGALRYKPHPTHFTIDQASDMARKLHAGQTYLTHLCHEVSHEKLSHELPDGIAVGYDMLTFEVDA